METVKIGMRTFRVSELQGVSDILEETPNVIMGGTNLLFYIYLKGSLELKVTADNMEDLEKEHNKAMDALNS